MTAVVAAADLDLTSIVRPGDQIVWGQATGEPLTLTETLVAQRADLGGVSVFLGAGFSDTLQPEHADHIRLRGFGAIGTHRRLAKAGVLEIVPCHIGQIGRYIDDGAIACDVAFVQVSPADAQGRHSFGVINDYVQSAVRRARVVVAEVNDRVPWTTCEGYLPREKVDVVVETSRPVAEVKPRPAGPVEQAIAGHAAAYIGDGATLQMGIGAIPDAILQCMGDRRDLGLHSGMVSDAVVDLIERGVLTNAAKPFDRGVSVAGSLIGTERLYRFAHLNPAIVLKPSRFTHGAAVLGQIPRLIAINAAIEVDLTGQVNAEQAGDDYVGGVGGQADYVRAGHRSPGGRSIIALPATARGGSVSRIVPRIEAGVTTARSDADIVVTEFGAADLRAQPLAERARRMIAIAHPAFRETLERSAHELLKRGY
jgi:acyl-CoA hydrolase